jgi:hypothetical protein
LHAHLSRAKLTLYTPPSSDSSDEEANKTKGRVQAKESGKDREKESSRHRPKGDLEKEKEKLAAVYKTKNKRSRFVSKHLKKS